MTVRYGYTLNSECEICRSTKDLKVDHDHVTRFIRGTLCNQCNSYLGAFEKPTWVLCAPQFGHWVECMLPEIQAYLKKEPTKILYPYHAHLRVMKHVTANRNPSCEV